VTEPFAARLLALLERPDAAGSDEPGWVRAFTACAAGRFSDALALGQRFILECAPLESAQLRLTVGSALRQLGRHRDAERVDLSDVVEHPLQRIHLVVSAAADAVGRHDALGAAARIEQARAALAAAPTADELSAIERERARIRAAWVATEIALLAGRPTAALEAIAVLDGPLPAFAGPAWPRHRAKTALFRGVVLAELGERSEAGRALADAASIAESIGAQPILDVATRMRAQLAP